MPSSPSPSRSVTDELLDASLPPFAIGTPARERAARHQKNRAAPVQSLPWRSNKYTGVDTSPWHRTRIVAVLREALEPTTTVEALLHSAHCLFLSTSESRVNRDALRALPALVPLAAHLHGRSDHSHSGSRVKEHVINAMTMLIGEDPTFDSSVAFDFTWMNEILPASMMDAHASVVVATARHVRRLSEIGDPIDVPRQLIHNDAVFESLLRRYETCEEVTVRHHVLCALVNVTTDSAVHFFLARCMRLVQLLLDEVFAGAAAGTRVAAALWVKEERATMTGAVSIAATTPRQLGGSASPTVAAAGGSVVRPRPGLSDVSPLYRFSDRSREAMRQRAAQQREAFAVVTATPRIAGLSALPPPPTSPGARSMGGASSLGVQGGMTPKPQQHGQQQQQQQQQAATSPSPSAESLSIDAATAAQLALCELSLRVFANLLSSEAQCAEIQRFAPSLMQAAVDCRAVPAPTVMEAATEVLRRLHDCNRSQVEHDVAIEVLQGRALAQQLRSKIGYPAADARSGDAAESHDDDSEADWEGALNLPDPVGSVATVKSSRGSARGSEAPASYSSRGLGSALSLVRRSLGAYGGQEA